MAKIATREAYGTALAELGSDPNIIVLDADLSKSTKTDTFKKKYPDRFVNVGIAEGNMMAVAAGIASTGKTVFASTFAIFAALRGCEQIRNSICYPALNVKVCATHAGISVGEDGASHQAIEDIAIMRSLPNMTVISPCDGISTAAAVKAAIEMDGPVYMRLGRLAVEEIYNEVPDFKFEIGKAIKIKEGKDVTIIATGLMVQASVDAVAKLAADGISARLIDMHTIKPIDAEAILSAAKDTGAIVTAEEHTVLGGLGSAVAEVLVQSAKPVPMAMVGIADKFGKSGKPDKLLPMYGLTSDDIVAKVKEVIKRK